MAHHVALPCFLRFSAKAVPLHLVERDAARPAGAEQGEAPIAGKSLRKVIGSAYHMQQPATALGMVDDPAPVALNTQFMDRTGSGHSIAE